MTPPRTAIPPWPGGALPPDRFLRRAYLYRFSTDPIPCDVNRLFLRYFSASPRIISKNSRGRCIPSGIRTSSDAGLGRTASTINIRISRGTAKDRTHIKMLSVLRSGLSSVQNTGRLPVDLHIEKCWRFPEKIRVLAISPNPNSLFLLGKQGQTSDHAFSPIDNSADLKATPHEWSGQYPSGFFARYSW